jgi:hypothetical protein
MSKTKYNAKFVSVWAGGTTIENTCYFDEMTNTVIGVEPVDPHLFTYILDEYVLFKNQIVKQFNFA